VLFFFSGWNIYNIVVPQSLRILRRRPIQTMGIDPLVSVTSDNSNR
jgi:hypothetical protein